MSSVRGSLLVLAVACCVAVLVSTALGPVSLPLTRAFSSDPGFAWMREVLLQVRLPRALAGLLVGAALASSGAVLQGAFRNPLADPAVLGVSAVAALCAQLVTFLGIAPRATFVLPVAASIGAAVGLALLLTLVRKVEGTLESLLLGGVALGQLAIAASTLLVSLALRDFTIARRLLYWMLGGLDGRTWMHVLWGAGPVVLGVAWMMYRARELDALLLGETTALGMGVDVRRLRRELVIAAAVLSGVSVAIAGVIGFVGLVVPHAARRFVGASYERLLLGSALAGGAFVVLSDIGARLVIAPEELQLGCVTALIGAPFFFWSLARRYAELSS